MFIAPSLFLLAPRRATRVYGTTSVTGPRRITLPFFYARIAASVHALVQAAAATLRELAKNPKYVGSSGLGFTGVLHTWGRTLSYHPHLHFIVPGGALSEDGQEWLPSRVDFFVPVEAASLIYRAKFLELMASAGLLDQVPRAAGEKN